MMRKLLAVLMIGIIGMVPFGFAFAQDATEPVEPAEGELEVITTLETLTADAASYYGQEITIEGTVEELLNVRTFVLGEAAAVDNDQVLVINNTGSEFDLQLVRDRQVRLIGTVYPSIDEGGLGQLSSGAAPVAATDPALEVTLDPMAVATAEVDVAAPDMAATEDPMAMATAEAGMEMTAEAGMEMTDEAVVEPTATPEDTSGTMPGGSSEHGVDFSLMTLPEQFNNYTIIVLNSLDTITYIEQE